MIIVFLISLITCSMNPETAVTFTHGHFKWFLQCALHIDQFNLTEVNLQSSIPETKYHHL